MCMYGLETHDARGGGRAYKPTRIITNSSAISELMNRQCDGSHVHAKLEGGSRCAKAARYTVDFVDSTS